MKKGIISIISVMIGILLGGVLGAKIVSKVAGDAEKKANLLADKHLALFLMMNQWVKIKQNGKNLSAYFEKNGYKKIAIYGMSYAGQTLLSELKNSNVNVMYGIDKNVNGMYEDVTIVSVDDYLANVDAIVVTAITFYDEIEKRISQKMNCPIISLEDILYEI